MATLRSRPSSTQWREKATSSPSRTLWASTSTGWPPSAYRHPTAPTPHVWTVERGSDTHILRARYEVPEQLGYRVGDITINGEPVQFGAQLADRVTVRITAIVN